MPRSQISHMEGFSPTIGHFYVSMETNNPYNVYFIIDTKIEITIKVENYAIFQKFAFILINLISK